MRHWLDWRSNSKQRSLRLKLPLRRGSLIGWKLNWNKRHYKLNSWHHIRWSSCSSYCKDVWVYQEERCSCCKHFLSTIIGAYHLFKLTTITFPKVLGDVINFTLPLRYRTHGGYWWFGLMMRPNGTCMVVAFWHLRKTCNHIRYWIMTSYRMLIDATHIKAPVVRNWYHSYPPLSLLGVVISISTTFSDRV